MWAEIQNQLYDFSNLCIELKEDFNLPIPALSLLTVDHQGINRPLILANTAMIPTDRNVLAHILSHEWGHHFLEHVRTDPQNLSVREKDRWENEADMYASGFIAKYEYDKNAIVAFLRETCPETYEERARILLQNK